MALDIEARESVQYELAERLDIIEEVSTLIDLAEKSYNDGGYPYAKRPVNSKLQSFYLEDKFRNDTTGKMQNLLKWYIETFDLDDYIQGIGIDHSYNSMDGPLTTIVSLELALNTPEDAEDEELDAVDYSEDEQTIMMQPDSEITVVVESDPSAIPQSPGEEMPRM